MMDDDYQVIMPWGCSVYPVKSTAGYVLFSHPVMSHTPNHDDDDDRQASFLTTLMGIDAVAVTDERGVLLDVERDSSQYGSTLHPTSGGVDFFLYWLLILMLSFFHRAKNPNIAVNGCKKSKVLHTLLVVVTELFLFTVRFCTSRCSCPNHFTLNSFGGDFLAGITVASMLVPQSVSYASSLAKLSPVTGLVRYHFILTSNLLISFSFPHQFLALLMLSWVHPGSWM